MKISMDRIDYLTEDDIFIANHKCYADKIKHFLKEIKMLCVQYAVIQKIQSSSYDESNDINLVGKVTYDGTKDIIYVYLTDLDFAHFVGERIKYVYWCFHPCTTQVDTINDNCHVLELHYENESVIERNEANELKFMEL